MVLIFINFYYFIYLLLKWVNTLNKLLKTICCTYTPYLNKLNILVYSAIYSYQPVVQIPPAHVHTVQHNKPTLSHVNVSLPLMECLALTVPWQSGPELSETPPLSLYHPGCHGNQSTSRLPEAKPLGKWARFHISSRTPVSMG